MQKKTIKQKAKFFIYHDTSIKLQNENEFDCDEEKITLLINCRREGCEAVHYLDEDGVERVRLENSPNVHVADDFNSIPLNKCRSCHRIIKFYEKNYWKYECGLGSESKTLYCYENGYCEKCAKKKEQSSMNRDKLFRLYEVSKETTQIIPEDAPTVATTYSDGSIIEDYPYGPPKTVLMARSKER